jgi:hypothetical protein
MLTIFNVITIYFLLTYDYRNFAAMREREVHQKLHDLCRLGIVRKEYIDIRVLNAILHIPEEELQHCLHTLEAQKQITLNGDIIILKE